MFIVQYFFVECLIHGNVSGGIVAIQIEFGAAKCATTGLEYA